MTRKSTQTSVEHILATILYVEGMADTSPTQPARAVRFHYLSYATIIINGYMNDSPNSISGRCIIETVVDAKEK